MCCSRLLKMPAPIAVLCILYMKNCNNILSIWLNQNKLQCCYMDNPSPALGENLHIPSTLSLTSFHMDWE